MVLRFCKLCQKDTDWDETPVCTSCGCFQKPEDDNTYFTEAIEYSDNKQVGTTVSGPEKTRIRKTKRFGVGSTVDTTWDTFERGKRAVLNLATSIGLPLNIVNSANNTYRLGLYLKFTSGRSLEVVAASCLYISCRLNSHPVLLFDFIENMSSKCTPKILSHVCMNLCRVLSITLPPVLGGTRETSASFDPSAFLYRFADKLELGEKSIVRSVAITALRILKRMQRDWIHWGRHPAGLFGAALLVASRLHGFKRTQLEVSKVVYVGGATVGKRVSEFAKTPSASLSIGDFDNNTFAAKNPPCFEKGRLKWKNPEDFVRWPEKLPSCPEEVKKWIAEGMGADKKLLEDTKLKKDALFKEKGFDNIKLKESLLFEKEEDAPSDIENSENIGKIDRIADDIIILDKKEIEKKRKIWNALNEDWIEKQRVKEEEKKAEVNSIKKEDKKPGSVDEGVVKKKRKRKMTSAYRTVLKEREKFLKARAEGEKFNPNLLEPFFGDETHFSGDEGDILNII